MKIQLSLRGKASSKVHQVLQVILPEDYIICLKITFFIPLCYKDHEWLQKLFSVSLNWINQPTHSNFFFSETNPACYVQTCEQFIIGRDLTYKEALLIVQNEKYLKVADIERVVQVVIYESKLKNLLINQKFDLRLIVFRCCDPDFFLFIFRTISGLQTQESRNNLMPYYGLDNKIIVPSHKYKPVQKRTRRSAPSNETITSELESEFRRPKRDTSDEAGFKSALQRLGREVNLTSRLITWPPREVRLVKTLSCLNFEK